MDANLRPSDDRILEPRLFRIKYAIWVMMTLPFLNIFLPIRKSFSAAFGRFFLLTAEYFQE
jgi:hypothetical protein